MYCSACGTASSEELSYCKRCGANLKSGETAIDSLLDGIFWTTVIGLGVIFGGIVALKKSDVRDAIIYGYMILGSLAFLGIYGMHLWQFVMINRGNQPRRTTLPDQKFATAELNEAEAGLLPEPAVSVTDNTTRSFEPVYRNKERR
jgi:hypothetical protein